MFDETDNAKGFDEQAAKEIETLQLLVSAGYFRARIQGLSTFDKVIGGMTWCIQGCKMNIDIDLFFQENANIGKKIALTEKIVRVLKRMRCPHRIEPHQVQGSDFVHIFPVVQWLVKQTLSMQDERMSEMKVLACQYFDRNCSFIKDTSKEQKDKVPWSCNIYPMQDCSNIIDYLNVAYWPQRLYKKPESMKNSGEEISVVSTLLEYGKKEIISDRSGSTATKDMNKTENENNNKEADFGNLQNQMSYKIKETNKMASKMVSKLLELKLGDVKDVVEDYETKSTLLIQSSQMSNANKSENINRAIADLEADIIVMKNNIEEREMQISKISEKGESLHEEINHDEKILKEINDKIEEDLKHCPAEVNIDEVQSMVERLDHLKEEERHIKNTCKEENEELLLKLNRLENLEEPIDDEEKVLEIQGVLAKEKKRLQNGRLRLADKTKELKQLELFLDNIPSKREIQQYQKRFVELNEQMNKAYAENKQLYDMYNIQDSVKDCLQREVNLLNSIHDNFKESMQSTSTKEQMIKQMEQVGNTIRDLKRNGENHMEKTKAERDQRKEDYNIIVTKSREYARITKQLQETLQYFDELLQRCQDLGVEMGSE